MVDIKRSTDNTVSSKKQLEVVERVLNKGKRYFGSSAASLTHQISNPKYKDAGINAGLAKVGLEGERRTSLLVKDWMKDKPNVVMVDSVHIKGAGKEEFDEETGTMEGGDTDHVLIIGNYIILIDSKNWKDKRRYGVREDGQITRGGKPFLGGKVHAKQAMYLWRKSLERYSPMVNSIICITSENITVVRDRNWWKQPFKVVSEVELIDFLDKIWNKIPEDSKEFINSSLVSDVVINAIKPYDVVKELLGSAAYLLHE